ncbi:cobalamin biosynthesis protein CobG [Ornithinimicrobium pratense]|uniref:cobalamin biosynthesis protein CobG n=1 Tax=Ornithinimicrobium pratense TaxID=2593973 RepID=UPI0017889B35|nr:cobalamin biosynthesis protein CobG [Ornithinimicrobium pratense]
MNAADHRGQRPDATLALPARTGGDACPGTLRPHPALDGSLVRLRLPGGGVDPAALDRLMGLARRHGSPMLQLTSRGNLQVRGLPDPLPSALVDEVEALGLLPSRTHERARGILAVPDPVAQALARQVDEAVQAQPDLTELPGRFLTVVSDGSAQLLAERWDLALQVTDPAHIASAGVRVLVAPGHAVRHAVPPTRAVAELVGLMRAFLRRRPDERTWNVRDLLDPASLHPDLVPAGLCPPPPLRPGDCPGPGQLVAAVPLGLLRPQHTAAFLRAAGDGGRVVLTPWRSVVLDLGQEEGSESAVRPAASILADAGLVVGHGSPWARLSACVGAPHCRRTTSPTLALTAEAAGRVPEHGARVHVVGCGRACGRPQGDHILVVDPTHPDQIVQEAR